MKPYTTIAMTLALLVVLAAPAVEAVKLKIATVAPDGTAWMTAAREAAEEVAERTDGRVTFRFYPGGTMGNESTVMRKIRIGQLHGSVVLSGVLATVETNMEIYNLPLLFHSYDEVDHVRRELDPILVDLLGDKGLVAFGFMETGFVYLMSTKPTRTFDDLSGRKTWIPEGDPIATEIADVSGLSPVPLPISDVLTGLQTGLIDTIAAPPVGAVALQWFTRTKYVTDLPITYVYGSLVISEKAFNKLTEADREVVREVMSRMSSELDRQSRSDNSRAREALIRQGVEFVEPTDATRARWREVAAEASRRLVEERGFDAELLKKVRKLLAEYRHRDEMSE